MEMLLITIGLITFMALCVIVSDFIGTKRSHLIENAGEAIVRATLTKYCKSHDAHVLNNITLRLREGSTTQVDHIIVSTKGIFVIETKHYSGWIFANPGSKTWTKVIYKLKYKFQNPIFQNKLHVKAVQRLLNFLNPKHVHNIVVFTGDAEFKTAIPDNVFSIDEFLEALEHHPDDILSLNRVQFCVGRLEYERLELTQKTDIEHQNYLQQRFDDI